MKELQVTQTKVDASLKETKFHGTEGFRMAVYLDDFSDAENDYICWHWHEEVQITMIIEGDFVCQVENEEVLLRPGEAIYINGGALHQIYPVRPSIGKLYSFIWKADLIGGSENCDIYKSSVEPVLKHELSYVAYKQHHRCWSKFRELLLQIATLFMEKTPHYQLKLQNLLTQIWLLICEDLPENTVYYKPEKLRDDVRVKKALQFMEEHYGEDITLEDIAKATLIGRSELCRCFKRTLNMSPKEFLLQYRIRQASFLLKNSELRILDVAEMTGFSSPSHFGSYFHKYMGCTPKEYRAKNGREKSLKNNK